MKFTDTEKRWLLENEEVQRQHVFNWENGGGISMKYLPLVAKVKGITVDALIAILMDEEKISKASAG